MKVGLLTDAPKHNLALMKLSTYHQGCGDEVLLNMPLWPADTSYASVLFERSLGKYSVDSVGGPAVEGSVLPPEVESCRPDYDLFLTDYSLGYTFRPCYRGCSFCKVSRMNHPDTDHHSIWEFHDAMFKKICLLNNNTFMDPRWRETFEEIWDAGLAVIDENGYDLRLLDDERAAALKRTKWAGQLHFAWDRMEDEEAILRGFECLKRAKVRGTVYVLVGYDTTEQQDLRRCQKIVDFGCDPYVMPYNGTREEKAFKRFIDSFMWRKYPTVAEAWQDYQG